MNLSKYNLYSKEGPSVIISNTLSGNIVKINDKSILDNLKNLSNEEAKEELIPLFEMGFVVNDKKINEEDLTLINYQENKEELIITLFLTDQCNFRCIYCYEKHSSNKLSFESYDVIYKFIQNQIQTHSFNKLRLNLFGGEPLLEYKAVIPFLEKLNDLKNEKYQNMIISIGITSNAYLLSAERFKNLYRLGLTDIQITVDGFKKDHDKKRFTVNGGETWEHIMNNLDNIVKLDLPVKVILRTNFEQATLKNEKEFLIYCKERFNNKFIMHFEAIKNWGDDCGLDYMNDECESFEINELVSFCRKNDIHTSFEQALNIGYYACQHNFKNSYIFNTKLEVLKCTVELSMKENYVGKLCENASLEYNDYIELWNNTKEECTDCALLPQCLKKRCSVLYVKYRNYHCSPKCESRILKTYKKFIVILGE